MIRDEEVMGARLANPMRIIRLVLLRFVGSLLADLREWAHGFGVLEQVAWTLMLLNIVIASR